MDKPLVLTEVRDRIGWLTLNHPEKRNALSRALLEAMRDNLTGLAQDRGVHVVILGAEGPVFSSGHDLRELINGKRDDYISLFGLCTQVMETIRTMPQPVIAQVQGLAT